MRSLASLVDFKKPFSPLHLVDVALILAIIPHLDRLKFPMLVYLLTVFLVLLFFRERPKWLKYLLVLFGLLSVISSFYSDFNFASFNKFALYLSFLNVLLIFAVTLQRLENKVNFYLAFSPALLLTLSFFLHNSVLMLFYMVFTLFVFLLLFLWQKMQGELATAFKMALSVFAYALPIVAILFLVFPRINFEKAEYGFSDILTKRSGHNGRMSLGSDALLVPSSQVIMEVYFKKPLTKGRDLYFRGTVLYQDKDTAFLPLAKSAQHPLRQSETATHLAEPVDYDVTLYPHDERWLYGLDIPVVKPEKSQLLEDYTLVADKKVKKSLRYSVRSYMQYQMNAPLRKEIKKAALQIDLHRDEVSAKIAKSLHSKNDVETLNKLAAYFRSLGLTYTLKPDTFDTLRPIDSFLQENKKGYCVHFAAAFTYMARAAGLPARVVTGFRSNSDAALGNYLVVREYDAHAWVEVYLKKQGWRRVETTALAQYMDKDVMEQLGVPTTVLGRLLHESNLRFMYVKYIIETWVLEYSRMKQMEILKNLLSSNSYLIKAILYLLLFVMVSIGFAIYISGVKSTHTLLKLMQPLFKTLQKEGLQKRPTESMHHFFKRAEKFYDAQWLEQIDLLYQRLRYGEVIDAEDEKRLQKELKVLIKQSSKNLKNG